MTHSLAVEAEPEVAPARPAVRPKPTTRKKPQRQHAVILNNDSVNSMEHVVGALRKVFHYGRLKAFRLMFQAHFTGRSIVWTGSLEVAELKADQLRSCGPDPVMKARGALTLRITVELLPG